MKLLEKRIDTSLINSYLEGDKITLIDVGTRDGIDARWDAISSLLHVIGFEPDEEECRRINEHAKSRPYEMHCFPYALGRSNNSKARLHICKKTGCSSLYEPNTEFVKEFRFGPYMDLVKSYGVTLTTLGDICDRERVVPDCIKIDTQGSELDILIGSLNILEDVNFLELEVEFNSQYKKQPLFSDIDLFLRSKGFILLGLRRTNWRRVNRKDFPSSPFGGQIIHGDAIYYNGRLLEESQLGSTKNVIKLCIILSVYRQDDFIAYLLGNPHDALKEIPEKDRNTLAQILVTPPTRLSSLLGTLVGFARKKLGFSHESLRRFLDTLQNQNAGAWHDPTFY